ncbi:MAG: threonine synthase, partial [Nitrospirae bacterium]
MGFVTALKCRECGRQYSIEPIYVCEFCFGPLEVVYDYQRIKKAISKKRIENRDENLWRYKELLPIDGEPQAGLYSGFTPLVKANNLARELGVKEL